LSPVAPAPTKKGMRTRVKICGITNADDAQDAVNAGADALGFNFYQKSPRYLTVAKATEITKKISLFVMRVGVFVNAPKEQVAEAIHECRLEMLQFHGEEQPEFCTQFGLISMKAFRILDAGSLEELKRYKTDAYLLDAWAPDEHGGTGKTFNWELAKEAQKLGRPIFLAGGLTPENVAAAVRKVRQFGVDVSSGVESYPGKKDPAKVRAFINAVRKAE
jgi:phosphoribosylanthranilate isomerase